MEQNLSMTDRYLRITLGGLFVAVGAARLARNPDVAGLAAGLLGGMMLAEGTLGTCPAYAALGINTNPESPAGHRTNDVIQPYEGI